MLLSVHVLTNEVLVGYWRCNSS